MEVRENKVEKTKKEKNIELLFGWIIIVQFAVIVILIITIVSLLPLKEKVPYLVEFKTSQENYVTVKKANKDVLANRALIHSELEGYIKAREVINKIDEPRRYLKVVRIKSSDQVYKDFTRSFTARNALYAIKGFSRDCQIYSIDDVVYSPKTNQFISIVEYSLIDKYPNIENPIIKYYKVTVKYEFLDKKIPKEDITLSPLGTHINNYEISPLKDKPINEERPIQ